MSDVYDIEFNDEHDVFLRGADIAFCNEYRAVTQKLTIRLQFLFQEWFLDNTAGVPYIQTVFKAGTSINEIHSIFSREITNTPGS
jgi:hypothetical protein